MIEVILAIKFPKFAGGEDGSVVSEEFPQGMAHTILRSAGNHIPNFDTYTSKNVSRQFLRDAQADERACRTRAHCCPRPKSYCWLRQRAIVGCAKELLLAAPKSYCWLRQRVNIAGCAKELVSDSGTVGRLAWCQNPEGFPLKFNTRAS